MMHASKVFANLLGTVARVRRADTSRLAADTIRRKFEFDAVRAALEHIDELQKISRENKDDRRLREAKAAYRVFGKVPLSRNPGEQELFLFQVAEQLEAEDAAARAAAKAKVEPQAKAEVEGEGESKAQAEAASEPQAEAAPSDENTPAPDLAAAPETEAAEALPTARAVTPGGPATSNRVTWNRERSCWVAATVPCRQAAHT